MPAPHVTLRLNHARRELSKRGYANSLVAGAFRFADLFTVVEEDEGADPPVEEVNKFKRVSIPRNLWQEPNTGVLMLRPSMARMDYVEEAWFTEYSRLGLADLDYVVYPAPASGPFIRQISTGKKELITLRNSTGGLINWLVQIALDICLDQFHEEMHTVWKTKQPLRLNEGWGVQVETFGLNVDRPVDWQGFYFGDRYFLVLNTNGSAYLYEDIRDPKAPEADANWVFRETFHFGQGGIDMRLPFQLMCIPWGKSYISFIFSQSGPSGGGNLLKVSRATSRKESCYLYDTSKFGREPVWNEAAKQWEKVPAAKLACAIRGDTHQFAWQVSRLRYKDSVTTYLLPFHLPEPRTLPNPSAVGTTLVELFGHVKQRVAVGSSGTSWSFAIYDSKLGASDSDGHVWASDYEFEGVAIQLTLNPDESHTYTPEVWSRDFYLAPETYVPELDPANESDKWVLLRIQKTAGCEASLVEAKLHFDENYEWLYRRGGPIQIRAEIEDGEETEDKVIFDGYVTERLPTMRGGTFLTNPSLPPDPVTNKVTNKLMICEELQGLDMWDRLNNTPLGDAACKEGHARTGGATAITGGETGGNLSVGNALKSMISWCGFDPETQIDIDEDLFDLDVSSQEETNSLQIYNPDAMVGDAIRELVSRYGIQDKTLIRIRWIDEGDETGPKWKVGFAPQWIRFEDDEETATNPTKIFYLDSTLVLDYEGEGEDEDPVARDDTQRWNPFLNYGDEQHFFITEQPEWTINRPEFTALICNASIGSADDAEAIRCVIEADPNIVNDPEDPRFEAQMRYAIKGPPEITSQDDLELQRQARHIFDQSEKGLVQLAFAGEWQPGLEPDDYIMVVGRNMEGNSVSYGAYRIQSIDIELRHDHTTTRWEWHGNYTCVYVGRTSGADPYPMFSGILP